MPLPKIPTFEELLKRVKQPPELPKLAPEFRNLPMGWSLSPTGLSLISPRGLTFRNLELKGGKITNFQAFRGEKPISLRGFPQVPRVWEPPTIPEAPEFREQPPSIRSEKISKKEARTIYEQRKKEIGSKYRKPQSWEFKSEEARLGYRTEAHQVWEEYQSMLRTGESIEWTRLQEQIRTGGIPLEQYEALSEEQKGMLVKQGEFLGGVTLPSGERGVEIGGGGEGLSLSEKLYRFQTGDIPAEDIPEPFRTLGKTGKAAIAAAEAPLFTIAGVPISAGDIAAVALISFGIYQAGSAGWNMLLDRVLKKPGDLNLLGRKLTEAGLNRNLNIWERQSGTKIPAKTRSEFISKYLEDMAASWARNVQGKAVNVQALQIASQDTYKATANAVNKEITALIPKGTQTGALAMGGVPQPTIQSVAQKIMNNQALTLAERQLYANEAQAVEAELQARVTPQPPSEAVEPKISPVTPEVRPPAAPEAVPEAIRTLPLEEVSKLETRVPLDLIRKDEGVEITRLTKEIQEEGITEPITIRVREDSSQIVWDGLHRLIVAQDLGIKNIPVTFIGEIEKLALKPPAVEVAKPLVEVVPTRAEIAKLAEQVKAKVEVAPPKPLAPKSPVERRTEIKALLTEPAKNLPKGVTKIELRKELAQINKTLIPQEKALRSQIMATVRGKSLGITQSRNIFREVGGSRYLTNLELTQLEKVLKAVEKARPIRIKGKKVITVKNEELIQSSKRDLIDQGILTEETYKEILKSLNLSTDKYVDSQNFITNSQGSDIIREMRNMAILNPLGELKFGKPTALKYLTSQIYYAQVLGVKPLTNPLELAKVDFDLAYRAMSNAIDTKLREVNKAWGVSRKEILWSKVKNIPTKGSSALRDLLDKHEEAPAGLTTKQEELFNWFRNLNRSIINGENEVRKAMGVEEIPYRQAYVRHVPDAMASEIIQGTHPIPPSLIYWARRLVSKKIFNPMELHRQLSDDLANLYSKDLAFAAKDMVYTGLKEIHLAQPLRAFTERMGALSDIMPAPTRKWVTDYVNIVIKGQQTEFDESINAIVTESGIGGVIDKILKPFNRALGQRPITQLSTTIGKATIYSVMALPRPRLLRLMIRNLFQRTQELALHGIVATLRSFLHDTKALKELKAESRYLRSYTGIEEWPTDLLGKLGRLPLAPYQFTATLNADRGMSTAYYDYGKFIVDKKYKDMVGRTGKRWPSEKRTYTEEEGFLYPEEQKILLSEMELATRATQYQYIGLGMPEIFRHKVLIPLTRLQSWWMNYFTMFLREGFHRFAYGETMSGYPLPWSSRINWLKYLLIGGAILTGMGYEKSYLAKVLPHNVSPFAQFAIGLVKYVSADSDWGRAQAKRDMMFSWMAMVPGAMAIDEIQKLWSGEMPIWQALFYGREEDGPPPHVPDYGFPIEKSGVKKAEEVITESVSKLGKEDDVGRTEAVDKALEAGVSKEKLKEINARDWTYDITSLRRDIGDSIRNLDEDDIEKLEPIVGNYVEFKSQDKAYELLGDAEQERYIKDNPSYIVNRLFWNDQGLVTIPDLETANALMAQANKYNIPLNMIPAFQLNDSGQERIPSNRNLWQAYFDYYDLPGTSYLNMTQAQVDDGQLPEEYLKDWNTYQKLKTDTAQNAFRRGHREIAYSNWRKDFRRANAEFDQWLIDQGYNEPLTRRVARRIGRAKIPPVSVFAGVSVPRPRRAAVSYPEFPKIGISTGIRVRAPRVPGI